MGRVALVVIAKAPAPGRSKTRLCPPCTPAQAAQLAQAALEDTLAAVAATPARRRLLALDGDPGPWRGLGFELHAQRGEGLGERLADALLAAGGPALVVGMDTPQLSPALLARATRRLAEPGVDAVLGPALDGGYWTIGLARPDRRVFQGVPMSEPTTGLFQLERLRAFGLSTALLPSLRDVDTIEDAAEVARSCGRRSRFATAFSKLSGLHTADHEEPVAEAAGGAGLEAPDR
jgi:hypothetical protein